MPKRWRWQWLRSKDSRHSGIAGCSSRWLAIVACGSASLLAISPAQAATILERRIEVTILPDDTVREVTSIRIHMDTVEDLRDWSRYPIVTDLNRKLVEAKGRVVQANGKSEKIRRRDRDEISLSGGSTFHSSTRAVFLEPPGLTVGSTIEIDTVVEAAPYFPGGRVSLLGDDPVDSLSVTVRGAPPGWRWQIHGPDDGLTAREDDAGLTVTGRDLLPREGADDGPRGAALYPVLRFAWGEDTSWAGVGKWYGGLVAELPLQTAAVSQQATGLLGTDSGASVERSPAERRAVLDTFARSVQADVRYVAVEVGIGGYRPSPPAEVLERRWGDCKDKALLLIDLLATTGITAHPVLVLSAHSRQVDPEFPSPYQFNHLIVAIPESEVETQAGDALASGYLFVDATQPRGGTGWLQPGVQGQQGLVVLPAGGELVRLPVLPEEERITLVANLRIDPEGEAAGGAALAVTGMSALRLLGSTESGSPSRTENTVRQLLLAVLPGAELGKVAWSGKDGDLPALEVAAGLRIPHLVQGAGDRAWLSLPSLRATPEPRRLDDRNEPLVTDAVTVSLTWHLTLPPGCSAPEARNDRVINRAGSFHQEIRPEEGGRFTLARQVILGERWFEVDALGDLEAIAVAEHRALRRRLRFACGGEEAEDGA